MHAFWRQIKHSRRKSFQLDFSKAISKRFVLFPSFLRVRDKKMNENFSNDEMMKRILVNQRAIMEQSQKILQKQQQAMEQERERQVVARDKIPLALKVSVTYSSFVLQLNSIPSKSRRFRNDNC